MDAEENWYCLPEHRYGMMYIDHDRIVVGETAWRPVAEELINRYRNTAAEVHMLRRKIIADRRRMKLEYC